MIFVMEAGIWDDPTEIHEFKDRPAFLDWYAGIHQDTRNRIEMIVEGKKVVAAVHEVEVVKSYKVKATK